MKRIVLAASAALILAGCAAGDRYKAIATTCQTYAVALNTAAVLNRNGKLSPSTIAAIDQTLEPARAVCSGAAPSDDPAAVQKVADLVIVVLKAQGEQP